jgi:serine/threonine protein kinase
MSKLDSSNESSENKYQRLLGEGLSSEKFVRRALQMFEADFRMTALLALADWDKLDIVSPELFQAVASLQRPSWGMWNGLITGLKKAKNSVLRTASDKVREQVESAELLNTVLAQYELRLDSDTATSLEPMASLTRTSMPKKLRLNVVLTMPISLRNRIAHDAPSAEKWWDEARAAIQPLVEFHAYLNPLSLVLADVQEFPSPWFLEMNAEAASESQSLAPCSTETDLSVHVFNGVANDQSVIYVSPTGESTYSTKRGRDMLQTFQSLLGKTDSQEDDFRDLLSKLAPDEIRGVMLGPYLVGKPAGRGGFATVHVGRELSTGRKVAVKILLDGQDDRSKERFQQEARFLSRIDHPNVVQIFGYGEETWSAPRSISLSDEEWFKSFSKSAPVKSFIAMEWVEGRTLDEYINPADKANQMSDRQIAEWFAQATSALSAVHFSGLVHRDLKPSNLMVDEDGKIKLMDFGIARSQDKERTLQTATGSAMGTLAYMSPEQIRAANKEAEVGPPTDIYSLCATFYELFTHRRLFGHDTESLEMITTRKLAGERPERPRLIIKGLPWELETILMGGLKAHVEDRYPSMEAVRHDIERFLNDEPIEYKRPTLKRRLQLAYRRNRLVANITMFFVVLAMAGSAWYVTKIQLALDAKNIAEKERIEANELRLQGDINLLLSDTNSARVVLEKFDDLSDSDRPLIGMLLERLKPSTSSRQLTPHEEIRIRIAFLRWRTNLQRTQTEAAKVDGEVNDVIDQALLSDSLLEDDALDDLKNASDLTRVEKSKLQAMQEVMMSAPPAEVVLIRDTVAPQAGVFSSRLWSVLQDPKRETDRRLRAACCLAAWDPDNKLWASMLGDVAGFLVEQNPLEIQDWIAAFAKQHKQLVPHLKQRFNDRSLDHRKQSQLAALILSRLVNHDPKEMAELIVNSNSEQFNPLFAAFVPEPGPAISSTSNPEISLEHQQFAEHLQKALARGPATIHDLYSSDLSEWPDPDTELREAVKTGFGLISKRFAFVGQLSTDEFDRVNTQLASCGFRLNRYRRSQSSVAAVWVRDGREAQVEILSSIKALKERVNSQAELVDGLRIIDASTFIEQTDSGPANRYVGLFQRKQPGDAVTRLQLDTGNSKPTVPWLDEGFLPLTFQQSLGASGQPIRCIVRRQELDNYPPWERNARKNIAKLLQENNALNWTGSPAHDISLEPGTPLPNSAPVTACVLWIGRNDVIGHLVYGVLNEQTMQQCRGLEQAGWEAVSISTTPAANNEQHLAMVWHQRQISATVNAQVADRRVNAAIALMRLNVTLQRWTMRWARQPAIRTNQRTTAPLILRQNWIPRIRNRLLKPSGRASLIRESLHCVRI